MIYSNGKVTEGPDLPSKRSAHCMVNLLDGKIMILGGDQLTRKGVLIFDPTSITYTNGPSLLYERVGSACTLIFSPMHENR